MKIYELGQKVYIVGLKNHPEHGQVHTIFSGKIVNRKEAPRAENYVYEIEGYDGASPARRVFESADAAKNNIIAHAKDKDLARKIVEEDLEK